MSSPGATPTPGRRWGPYWRVTGLFWVAPAAALLVGYLALPDSIPSHCDGTGFGCTITPKDVTVILAVFVYPFVVMTGLLIMCVIAMGRAWRHRPRRGRGLSCPAESNPHARRCSSRPPCKPGECVATLPI